MATLSFSGVTRERFDEIVARAEAKTGQTLAGDSASVSFKGCRGVYRYDEQRQQLDFNILSAPMGTMFIAKDEIKKLVEG